MNIFDVYKLWPIEPVKAKGCTVWDKSGTEYLDMYGEIGRASCRERV